MDMIETENFTTLKGQDSAHIFESLDLEIEMKNDYERMTQIMNQLKEIEAQSMRSFAKFQEEYEKTKNGKKRDGSLNFCSDGMKLENVDTKILASSEELITLR